MSTYLLFYDHYEEDNKGGEQSVYTDDEQDPDAWVEDPKNPSRDIRDRHKQEFEPGSHPSEAGECKDEVLEE